jgi:hypothetical protein
MQLAALLSLMQAAAVQLHGQVVAEQVAQEVVVRVVEAAQPCPELLIQVAEAVLLDLAQAYLVQVVRVLSLFPTLAHNVVLAAQLHQAVETLFTHLRPLGLLRLNF